MDNPFQRLAGPLDEIELDAVGGGRDADESGLVDDLCGSVDRGWAREIDEAGIDRDAFLRPSSSRAPRSTSSG